MRAAKADRIRESKKVRRLKQECRKLSDKNESLYRAIDRISDLARRGRIWYNGQLVEGINPTVAFEEIERITVWH